MKLILRILFVAGLLFSAGSEAHAAVFFNFSNGMPGFNQYCGGVIGFIPGHYQSECFFPTLDEQGNETMGRFEAEADTLGSLSSTGGLSLGAYARMAADNARFIPFYYPTVTAQVSFGDTAAVIHAAALQLAFQSSRNCCST